MQSGSNRDWLSRPLDRRHYLIRNDCSQRTRFVFFEWEGRGTVVSVIERSDNGSHSVATAVRKWLSRMGVKTLYIEPGSPLILPPAYGLPYAPLRSDHMLPDYGRVLT